MRAGSVALGFGVALAGLGLAPTVTLRRDEVAVPQRAAAVLEMLRERFEADPDAILASEPGRLVRRFEGTAGAFRYRTVERVVFEDRAVTFEHVSGPFAMCKERFDIEPGASPDSCRIVHTGVFRLRGGLWSAPLAVGPVRRAFEAHVHHHLEAMAASSQ